MRGFPVFVGTSDSGNATVAYLPRNAQERELLLSPIETWAEALQPFADLFPPARILSEEFFEAIPDKDTWQSLAEHSIVRMEIIVQGSVNFSKFYPDYPLREGVDHRTVDFVLATDLWHKADIMERVRDSQARARLFWRFLTEWLSPGDAGNLEIEQAECECGEEHRYYPAAWLEQLRENTWVRMGNDARTYATPQSIANLLRGDGLDPGILRDNIAATKLLEALGISYFDLLRAFGASNDEQRKEQDNFLTGILVAASGDVSHLAHARQYLEDLKNDPNLPIVLAKHREDKRIRKENQDLGDRVEDLVKQSLECEGFIVRRKPIGSDFEIEYDVVEDDKEMGSEVVRNGQSWLVEVKSTRSQGVRMTSTQARTAERHGTGFLLCVVPVKIETDSLELGDVRENMRFVQDIGVRLGQICESLDNVENARAKAVAESESDIQLIVDSGIARVSVANSVWENEGFPLTDLSSRLK